MGAPGDEKETGRIEAFSDAGLPDARSHLPVLEIPQAAAIEEFVGG